MRFNVTALAPRGSSKRTGEQVMAGRLATALICGLLLAGVRPAAALVVAPFFAGHGTINATTQIFDYQANVGFEYLPGLTNLDIDVAHGMVDDGGLISRMTPGDWNVDMDVWAPLMTDMDIALGGEVTYGNPVPGVFAATWVNVESSRDNAVRNTFQIVFVGAPGFHTNTGIAIAPGSVIFAYGAPSDPHGTVNLSADTPAAIGILHSGLTTLAGLGVGDSLGVLTTADLATLRNSGDPFLFNQGPGGLEPPVAFNSVVELGPTSGVIAHPAGLSLAISPNPLHSVTTMSYSLARTGRVSLAVYDIVGRQVATLADGVEAAGSHQRIWDGRADGGSALPTGLYLVRLAGDGFAAARKVVVDR